MNFLKKYSLFKIPGIYCDFGNGYDWVDCGAFNKEEGNNSFLFLLSDAHDDLITRYVDILNNLFSGIIWMGPKEKVQKLKLTVQNITGTIKDDKGNTYVPKMKGLPTFSLENLIEITAILLKTEKTTYDMWGKNGQNPSEKPMRLTRSMYILGQVNGMITNQYITGLEDYNTFFSPTKYLSYTEKLSRKIITVKNSVVYPITIADAILRYPAFVLLRYIYRMERNDQYRAFIQDIVDYKYESLSDLFYRICLNHFTYGLQFEQYPFLSLPDLRDKGNINDIQLMCIQKLKSDIFEEFKDVYETEDHLQETLSIIYD